MELKLDNDLVFIGIPTERFGIPDFYDSRDSVYTTLADAGMAASNMLHARGHRVDGNRDNITVQFLDHPQKPDWLLMLDSDMLHPANCGVRLALHRVPVVGALYFHRGTDDPLVFVEGGMRKDKWGRERLFWEFMRDEVYDYIETAKLPYKDDCFTIDNHPTPSLLECDALGTGCIMINRAVFEAMEPPWWEYRGGESEDLTFCWRVRHELNEKVYVDQSIICGHYISIPKGQAQFRQKFRGRGLSLTNYTPDDAIQWLEEFAGIENADKKMKEYKSSILSEAWDRWVESRGDFNPVDFYRLDDIGHLYLLDLLWWNASPTFSQFRKALTDVQGKKVLEIGSGIGSLAIQLALQRCDVHAVEVNKVLNRFMMDRFSWTIKNKSYARYGTVINYDNLGKVRECDFDLAIAVDVFEHFGEFELATDLFMIGEMLKPGGKLFFHNNWDDSQYSMHYDHSARWEEFLREAGLYQIGDVWAVKP